MTVQNDVLLMQDDVRIASLVLNRPAKRNAISPPMAARFLKCLAEATSDPSRLVVVRSAAEGVFCAGFDINYIGGAEEKSGGAALYRCFAELEATANVTVAFADGLVVGGGTELFLSCDLRLATARTTFRLTPVRLSQVYQVEGIARFVRAIGPTAATELFLTARPFTADEALRVGLVTRIVPDWSTALSYCREAAAGAPQAQRAMKAILKHLARDIARPEASEDEWRRIAELRDAAHGGEDRREALRAFAEKRQPIFTGR